MAKDNPRTRTLARALEIAGSREALAKRLDATVEEIEAWLTGEVALPLAAFHGALDIVARGKHKK
jgi:hypothetical protein